MSSNTAKIAVAITSLAAVIVAAVLLPLGDYALECVDYVRGAGALGVIVYIAVYAIATVLLIPGSLLTIGAGFIWGLWGGALVVLPASLTGAMLAFALGRSVARAWVGRKVSGLPRLAAVDEAIGERGFSVIFLMRLSPLVPFGLLNYFLGVTRARGRDYFLASATGMIPGMFLYVYLGTLITDAAQIASGTHPDAGVAGEVMFFGGLVATVAVTVYVSAIAKRKLEQQLT